MSWVGGPWEALGPEQKPEAGEDGSCRIIPRPSGEALCKPRTTWNLVTKDFRETDPPSPPPRINTLALSNLPNGGVLYPGNILTHFPVYKRAEDKEQQGVVGNRVLGTPSNCSSPSSLLGGRNGRNALAPASCFLKRS